MADTILGGDFTVNYLAENRQKRIEWTGAATDTRTVNELYSALQDLFDEVNQMDDGVPMSAQTPTEYTIGLIDSGDKDAWFIDRTSVEHLTGGALKTANWKRVTGTTTGIVRFAYTVGGGTDFVTGDIGLPITSTSSTGTLLDFVSDGSNGTAWVRPTDSTATHDWSGTPTDIAITGGTGASLTQDAASSTGESLWAGVFSIGTIEPDSHIYILQNTSLLTAYKDTTDWWGDDQIDILVNVKEVDTEVDEGVIRVYIRQQSKSYDNFQTDLTAGGRNPIPLATGDDLDNNFGDREMVLTDVSGGEIVVGNRILDDSDATIEGIVTAKSGSGASQTIEYYLIGDPQNDFTGATGVFSVYDGSTDTGINATAVAPSNVNAATYTDVTVTHATNETFDIDENDTTENYSIVIDCASRTLQQVQERLKFITRRGDTSTASTDGAEGQFYLGSDRYLPYDAETGTVSEGDVVTQLVSLATGTVVAHNATDNYLILRNSRGTFNGTNNVEVTGSDYVTVSTAATVIAPIKASPFGTFAGGKFFGARGVVLDNVPTADVNNYQLTDDDGNVVVAPNKVTIKVDNTRALDRIAVFRLTAAGGIINKTRHTGTVQSAGATTAIMGESIAIDEPGKSAGGVIRLVDDDGNTEYRLRFASWTASTFTLASTAGLVADATTDATQIEDAAGAFNTNARVGDLIRNVTAGGIGYVTAVNSDTNISTTSISGQTTGDTYDINTLPVATTTSDNWYIPLLDVHETTGNDASTGTEESIVTYSADIAARVVARNSSAETETTIPMLPYSADATVTSTGLTNNIIRSKDTIKT